MVIQTQDLQIAGGSPPSYYLVIWYSPISLSSSITGFLTVKSSVELYAAFCSREFLNLQLLETHWSPFNDILQWIAWVNRPTIKLPSYKTESLSADSQSSEYQLIVMSVRNGNPHSILNIRWSTYIWRMNTSELLSLQETPGDLVFFCNGAQSHTHAKNCKRMAHRLV